SQGGNGHAAANGRLHQRGVGVEKVEDLAAARKAIGIAMRQWEVGQPHRPIRKLKPQALPALASPALSDAASFEHEMRTGVAAHHVAHDETGLTATNNQGFNTLDPHGGRPQGAVSTPHSSTLLAAFAAPTVALSFY